jgi:hypothetical protein
MEFREKEIKPLKDQLKDYQSVLTAFEHAINLYRGSSEADHREAQNWAIAISEFLEENPNIYEGGSSKDPPAFRGMKGKLENILDVLRKFIPSTV